MEKIQFDFIKVKTQKVNRETVNWEMLNEHPTIRNAYTLDEKSGLHAKNFKLYFTKDDRAVLEASMPYLVYGHNHVAYGAEELKRTVETLQNLLAINLMDAEVHQFEYGCFAEIEGDAKSYIKQIRSYPGYDLRFSSTWMKMFGYNTLNFKIYDAVKNAKKKKTYSLGKYPKGSLIKYELKITDAKKHLKQEFYLKELCKEHNMPALEKALQSHIDTIHKSNEVIYTDGDRFSVNYLLYTVLKMYENKTGMDAYNFIMDFIDACAMTASQKSKKRKAIRALENLYSDRVL